jgi:WD40 repeat protein
LQILDEHEDSLYALAMFSSDPFILSRGMNIFLLFYTLHFILLTWSESLMTGRDKNVRLWSLNDRVETKRHIKSRGSYEGHKGTVHDVKFYPSRYVVVSCFSLSIKCILFN